MTVCQRMKLLIASVPRAEVIMPMAWWHTFAMEWWCIEVAVWCIERWMIKSFTKYYLLAWQVRAKCDKVHGVASHDHKQCQPIDDIVMLVVET